LPKTSGWQVFELTLQHPNLADLQIAQIISERIATPISYATIHRLPHMAHFKFLPPKRRQKLTEIQRQQRHQFASDFINGKLPTEKLIFFGESRFCMARIIGGRGEGEENMRKGFSPTLINIRGSRFIDGRRFGFILNLAFQFLKKQSIQMSKLKLWNRVDFRERPKKDSANASGILFKMVQAVTRVHRLWTLFLKSVTFSAMAAQFT
jgi:hypothetical protein